jgi:hypothetical protein
MKIVRVMCIWLNSCIISPIHMLYQVLGNTKSHLISFMLTFRLSLLNLPKQIENQTLNNFEALLL